MAPSRTPLTPEQQKKVLAELHRDVAQWNTSYRAKALKLLPHICGSCAREFSDKRLKELTVHHKDHNPNNNPPDGSNWELLCLYCHDHEHSKLLDAKHGTLGPRTEKVGKPGFVSPFDKLESLMKLEQKPEA
jgi:5-methylcytosine-specific restriction endonuclease McrA